LEAIENAMSEIEGVVEFHDTHVWSLDGEHHVLSTHLVVAENTPVASLETLKSQIRKRLLDFDIQHATIEIDFQGTDCGFTHHF
jgi:cobalt-zinc-cadmium efflux system protein